MSTPKRLLVLCAVSAGVVLTVSLAVAGSADASPAAIPAAAGPTAVGVNAPLAATPPMGWNAWYAFGCNVNEQLVEQTADTIVSSGMRDAGYQYVNLDDCWMDHSRDANGLLQADPTKFPDGIAAVADYVHARGLKLGIYEDAGTQTCAGYPGSYGHMTQDAQTFASWGVDFIKVDWCHIPFGDFPGLSQQQVAVQLYTAYGQALRATDRDILFSICEPNPALEPWTWAPAIGNMWRTNADYGDTWSQVLANLDNEASLASFAGPGHWNDPDILQVGLPKMTTAQDQAHFSAWSMLAAPLLAGSDLRSMTAATRTILSNREVIAVDQDPMGAEATRLSHSDNADVWVRPLANGDRAVMLLNRGYSPVTISTTASTVGLPSSDAYAVRDLWAHTTTESAGTIAATVPATSAVLYRVSPLSEGIGTYPPATQVSVDPQAPATDPGGTDHIVQAGQTVAVPASLVNHGRAALTGATLRMVAPTGWDVAGHSVTAPAVVTGTSLDGTWQVTVPAAAGPGTYQLSAVADYRYNGTSEVVASGGAALSIIVRIPGSADLTPVFGNVGITDDSAPAAGNFDGSGNSYSAQALAGAAGITPGGPITAGGVTFTWPDVPAGTADNVITHGQTVPLTGSGATLGFVGTGVNGAYTATGIVYYTDGSSQSFTISFNNWTNATLPNSDQLVAKTSYLNTQAGQLARARYLSAAFVPLQVVKTVQAVQLPSVGSGVNSMHLFAVAVG